MSPDEANIELVLTARVKVVRGKLPKDVRVVLDSGVKKGTLGHMKKDGYKPEVYYHPNFEYLANSERLKIEKETIKRLSKVL